MLRIGEALSHIPSAAIGLALGVDSPGFGLTYCFYIAYVWSCDFSLPLEEITFF